MTKQEAITAAIPKLNESGVTQFILRRGDQYNTHPSDQWAPRGWKIVEMISKGNVHAYEPKPEPVTITFNSPEELAIALRAAADAHHKYEQELGHADADWPTWYAEYIRKEQLEDMLVGVKHPKL